MIIMMFKTVTSNQASAAEKTNVYLFIKAFSSGNLSAKIF